MFIIVIVIVIMLLCYYVSYYLIIIVIIIIIIIIIIYYLLFIIIMIIIISIFWDFRSWSDESGQVKSVYRAHSVQAVVAHACHGHRYRPSLVRLSGTGLMSCRIDLSWQTP